MDATILSYLRPEESGTITTQTKHSYSTATIAEKLLEVDDGSHFIAELEFNVSGHRLRLNDWLPEGVRFVKIPEYTSTAYDPSDRSIVYGDRQQIPGTSKMVNFWSKGAILLLLHEVGHATYDPVLPESERSLFVRLNGGGDIGELSKSEVAIAKKFLAAEKRAWKRAIEIYNEINGLGINLEPGMRTESAVNEYADSAYQTYAGVYKGPLERASQGGLRVNLVDEHDIRSGPSEKL